MCILCSISNKLMQNDYMYQHFNIIYLSICNHIIYPYANILNKMYKIYHITSHIKLQVEIYTQLFIVVFYFAFSFSLLLLF